MDWNTRNGMAFLRNIARFAAIGRLLHWSEQTYATSRNVDRVGLGEGERAHASPASWARRGAMDGQERRNPI